MGSHFMIILHKPLYKFCYKKLYQIVVNLTFHNMGSFTIDVNHFGGGEG